MIIEERPTVRTGAIARTWVAVTTPSRPPEEVLEDAARLQQLSLLCANSYDSKRRNAVKYFLTDSELNYATHRQAFGPCSGRFFWRPLALVLLPFNYLAIFFWLLALIAPLIAVAAFTEVLVEDYFGWPFHFLIRALMSTSTWLCYSVIGGVAAIGLAVGAVIAFAPRLASGRAFGLVDTRTRRAIVIFRGSEPFHNATINALVFPYFFPLRHLGFHRAWDHIRPGVKQWLIDVVKEGQIKEIVFAGHSLGGALAQIAAFDLSREFPVSHVVSLGSACIGGCGVRNRFVRGKVEGGGRLQNRTRHFTYTQDMMPRIPPSSIFRQVGRRFRLPEWGGPVEGTEASLMKSAWDYFLEVMSFFASLFMDVATKIKSAILWLLTKLNLYQPSQSAKYGNMVLVREPGRMPSEPAMVFRAEQENRMTFNELLGHFTKAGQFFPGIFLAGLSALVLSIFAIPFIFMATVYWHHGVMFASGLSVQHEAGNYRDAFKNYSTSLQG